MPVSPVKVKPSLREQGTSLHHTRKPMVMVTSQVPLEAMATTPRSRPQCLKKTSPSRLMKKKSVQMVPMRASSTVDSVEKHSLSGQYYRFMSVPTYLTSRIIVVTALSPLIVRTSCACTLSLTLLRSHSSAVFVLGHSLERQPYTTTCARTQAKSHFRASDVERLSPRPLSYIDTRLSQGTVIHMTACRIN